MNAPTEDPSTTTNKIVLNWTAFTTMLETGNTFSIDSYNLQVFNSLTNLWNEVVGETTPFTILTYTMTEVTMGKDYSFRIRASNVHGFGEYSNTVIVRADDKPGVPSSVTTSSNGLYVDFIWSAPTSDNGSPITAYKL